MNEIKNPIILALSIIVVILFVSRGCGNTIIDSEPEVIDVKVKTVYLPGKDSIIHDTLYKWKTHFISNILPNIDSATSNESLSQTNTFYYEIKDSSLEATIIVNSEYKPNKVDFYYSVLEKEMTTETFRVDTIRETITKKVRVNQVYFGGTAIVYPGFNAVFANLDYVSKKGWQGEIGVGIMNNTPSVSIGFKKLITFRKK